MLLFIYEDFLTNKKLEAHLSLITQGFWKLSYCHQNVSVVSSLLQVNGQSNVTLLK